MHKLFPKVLRTQQTTLRLMTIEDAAGWKTCNNAIHKIMRDWPTVPSVVYARNEILHHLTLMEEGKEYAYTIFDKQNNVIGDFYIKSIDEKKKTAEFGHALHPSTWGSGITYETIEVIRRAAKRKGYTLWCIIEEQNARSWRSIEKYGGTLKGYRETIRHGNKVRERLYELPKGEHRMPTAFAQQVYKTISKVPPGRVTTYRDVAHSLGVRSYRAVGQALRYNPYAPQVPCHRVVASNGTLGGFFGEREGLMIHRKAQLLEKEGVMIKNNTVIDFEKKRFTF